MKAVRALLPVAGLVVGGPAGAAAGLAVGKLLKRKGRGKVDDAQTAALEAQQRAANAAQEDAAVARSEQAASGRRLRGLGRRSLAFQGVETGLASTLAG